MTVEMLSQRHGHHHPALHSVRVHSIPRESLWFGDVSVPGPNQNRQPLESSRLDRDKNSISAANRHTKRHTLPATKREQTFSNLRKIAAVSRTAKQRTSVGTRASQVQ